MKKSLKFIIGYLAQQKWLVGLVLLLNFLSSALLIIRPKIMGKIIDSVAQPIWKKVTGGGAIDDDFFKMLYVLSLSIMIITIVRGVLFYFSRIISEKISQSVIFSLRNDMYKKLNSLDFEFFDNHRTGDIMTKMTSDVDMIRHFSAYTVFIFIENLIVFIGATILLSYMSPILMLCFFTVVPVVMILGKKLSLGIRPRFHKVRECFSALNTAVQENIGGNRVVKAFATEEFEIDKFEKKNQDYANANREVAKFQSEKIPILDFVSGMLNVILILVGGILAVKGYITIGNIVTANGLLWALYNPLRMSSNLLSEMERAVASTERIQEFLETEPKIISDNNKISKSKRFMGEVEFKHVTFKYENDIVLNDISFKAQPGQTIAIIGPTGSGKSTLVNLISRFYDVSSGEVLIDGINVKDIDLKTLRDNVSATMQDIFLFSDTIEGNIAYANPAASFDEIKRASKAADAHTFISKMQDGYDTVVGERGVGLSGGQKQRIALARALLANPSILILDDTTSAVDMETEHYIQNTLKEYFADRTTFIIAHRISSVKNADLILVLSDGQLIEYGTHENLIQRPVEEAYYRSVFENQMGDFDSFYNCIGGEGDGKK